MKSSVLSTRIDWLCNDSSDHHQVDHSGGISNIKAPIPEHIGNIDMEVINLHLGMDIVRAVHHFSPDMAGKNLELAEVRSELAEPTLFIHSVISGQAMLIDKFTQNEFQLQVGTTMFQYTDQIHFMPKIDTSEYHEVVVLQVSRSNLNNLLGEEVANDLLTGLQLTSCPAGQTVEIPKHISSIIDTSNTLHLEGNMRITQVQANVLDYLCALSSNIIADISQKENYKRQMIKQLHNELINLDGKLPVLDELARRYSMSVKTLNDQFKEIYGQPIVRFITEQRLAQAHKALSESNVSIKTLAHRLGYSHVSHFGKAFKRQFNYTAGSLRK